MRAQTIITRGPTGHRTGASHGRAKLSDQQVDRMRTLNELGWGYETLAWLFGCGGESWHGYLERGTWRDC